MYVFLFELKYFWEYFLYAEEFLSIISISQTEHAQVFLVAIHV